MPSYMKKSITRLRLQSNRLEIVRGRYTRPKLPLDQRLCSSCKTIDDEQHLLTNCAIIADLRERTFSSMSNYNNNFDSLTDKEKTFLFLHPPSYEIALITGKYIIQAFKERNL